jgi:hypothetical protein
MEIKEIKIPLFKERRTSRLLRDQKARLILCEKLNTRTLPQRQKESSAVAAHLVLTHIKTEIEKIVLRENFPFHIFTLQQSMFLLDAFFGKKETEEEVFFLLKMRNRRFELVRARSKRWGGIALAVVSASSFSGEGQIFVRKEPRRA